MMSDTTSYADFFEHHPRASLLLSHTGTLRLNALARVLFGVSAPSADDLNEHDSQTTLRDLTTLQGLLHPDDYQQLHSLLTTQAPFAGQYMWRWRVARASANSVNNLVNNAQTDTTTLATHITLTEQGCSVVLEPTRISFDSTPPERDNDLASMTSDEHADLEQLLEDIVNTARTPSNVHNSYDLPLEVALEHLPLAVFCVDTQWRFSFANAPAARALGMTPHDLLGRSLWEVAPELSQHTMGDHYREAMAHGRASYHEIVAHDPPFTGRWHATHLRPFAEGLLVTIKDITQRKRSEESLLAQKAYSDKLLAERNAILASIKNYFFILDKSWTFTYANDATARYFGMVSDELIGQNLWEVTNLPTGHPILEGFQRAMDSGQAQHVEAASSHYPNHYLDVHVYPYDNGLVIHSKDVSKRKQLEQDLQNALAQKDMLMKELHHRTKNNLQLVASMLAMQAYQLTDENAKAALKSSQRRIHTLAEIHTMLYRQDASTLSTASYLRLLAENIIESTSHAPIMLECNLAPIDLPLERTITLGLIANELLTNALKYAFPTASDNDTIRLQLEQADDTITFVVYNNGTPLQENRPHSLGMTIIETLSGQLKGQFTLANAPEGGVVARVCFTV